MRISTAKLGFEFTELEVGGRTYCSIAFEAYPDDAALRAAFAGVVSRCLVGLSPIQLSATESLSYPAWLKSLVLNP